MLKNIANLLSEFSIPLVSGVVMAMIFANVDYEAYLRLIESPLFSEDTKIFGHLLNFDFLINDIFMIFFFGIAAVEITQAVLPGGALNPMSKATNPLIGTVGGILGPAVTYFLLCFALDRQEALKGWAIPTATDIALAWLVARMVFGEKHPAVSFLLLLAVADDAIGLAIIAIFYPNPEYPVEPVWLLLLVLGMLFAFSLRKLRVTNFRFYLLLGGSLSWAGLLLSGLHPALALVFIVPFMPAEPISRLKVKTSKSQEPVEYGELFEDDPEYRSTLTNFEHVFKYFVDFGLLGFGLVNAGVPFSGVDSLTWIVLASLSVGKVIGIAGFCFVGRKLGFPLPKGMDIKDLFIASLIAGIGLTVSLFIAGQAFPDAALSDPAKMGAIFSGGLAFIALALKFLLRIEKKT